VRGYVAGNSIYKKQGEVVEKQYTENGGLK